ncbi:hypothetical protein [Rhizobium sp. L1K21]|uniref:hypothetical protein n=1 Tax=Rhizobium sp. L1K21 TaxID=2954933 RepID=UPI0020928AFC|nr:hypothetical protein [Rhizobium sp. L1K21]MCO6188322.1 hypothetical protein [Rhizobium sp. L1K21]
MTEHDRNKMAAEIERVAREIRQLAEETDPEKNRESIDAARNVEDAQRHARRQHSHS